MCHTQELSLVANRIGDTGMISLAYALGKGALAQCTYIDLGANQIGDAGLSALGGALSSGTLASLKTLCVDDEEHPALKAACQARGIDLK